MIWNLTPDHFLHNALCLMVFMGGLSESPKQGTIYCGHP